MSCSQIDFVFVYIIASSLKSNLKQRQSSEALYFQNKAEICRVNSAVTVKKFQGKCFYQPLLKNMKVLAYLWYHRSKPTHNQVLRMWLSPCSTHLLGCNNSPHKQASFNCNHSRVKNCQIVMVLEGKGGEHGGAHFQWMNFGRGDFDHEPVCCYRSQHYQGATLLGISL